MASKGLTDMEKLEQVFNIRKDDLKDFSPQLYYAILGVIDNKKTSNANSILGKIEQDAANLNDKISCLNDMISAELGTKDEIYKTNLKIEAESSRLRKSISELVTSNNVNIIDYINNRTNIISCITDLNTAINILKYAISLNNDMYGAVVYHGKILSAEKSLANIIKDLAEYIYCNE